MYPAVRRGLTAVSLVLLWATLVGAQAACNGIGGTWEDSYGIFWTLSQSQSAVSGQVTGNLCGAGLMSWNVTGTVNLVSGQFSLTATGGGCTATTTTYTGSISGFTCDAATGTWVNNAPPPEPNFGSFTLTKVPDSGLMCDAPTLESTLPAPNATPFLPEWDYGNPTTPLRQASHIWSVQVYAPDRSFGGRTIREWYQVDSLGNPLSGADTCYFPDSAASEANILTAPSSALALSANSSHVDVVGWLVPTLEYYRGYYGSSVSCGYVQKQAMWMLCQSSNPPNSPSAPNALLYKNNDLSANIAETTVQSCRDGQCSTKTFPYLPELTAVATTTSQSSVRVDWSDNSLDATGFELQRATNAGGPWDVVGYLSKSSTCSGTNCSYTNSGLPDGTVYYYRIRPEYNAGSGFIVHQGPFSTVVSATIALSAPTSLVAAAVSTSQIQLSWVDNSVGETGYKVERLVSGSYQEITQVAANATSYTNSGLSPGTNYSYRISAVNASMASSTISASATTYSPPQPTSLWALPDEVSQTECYTIYVGNGANMTVDLQYRYNGAGPYTILGWPMLNGSGQATVCTDVYTAVGTYEFTAVRNTLNSSWVPVSWYVNVYGFQPYSFSASPSSVAQGECYTIAAGGGQNVTLDIQYTFNGAGPYTIWGWPTLDGSGQASICTSSATDPGAYVFTAYKNSHNPYWINTYAPVMVTSP